MPSLLIRATGKANTLFETDRFNVSALLDADGSAVILHAGTGQLRQHPGDVLERGSGGAGPERRDAGHG